MTKRDGQSQPRLWSGKPFLATLVAALALALCTPVWAEEDVVEDYTILPASVVQFEFPDQPLDTLAPPSVFGSPDGEALWRKARERALTRVPGRSGGLYDFGTMVPEEFIYAKDFANERFQPGENSEDLTVELSATEARRSGKKLELTNMRMTYYKAELPPPKPGDPILVAKPAAQPVKEKNAPLKPGEKKAKTADAPGMMGIPPGGRVVIIAPKCVIDLETNEGFASGGAMLEIFPKPEEGKPLKSTAKLNSEFMHWRSWNEAATGSTEIVMYTCSDDISEPDPEVTGTFIVPQESGPDSVMNVKGRGMIIEIGMYDVDTPVYDEDGRTAGTSKTARNKAWFHSQIRTEMTASTITAIMPFQGDPAARAAAAAKDAPHNDDKTAADNGEKPADKKPVKKKGNADPEPYKTIVTCNGPAIFDMAYVPRKPVPATTDPDAQSEVIELDLKPMFMGKRFEFLNQVELLKTPIAEKPPLKPGEVDIDMATHMSCGHLRIQYPPNSMPSMTSFPDYCEAVGGVKMFGYKMPDLPEPGQPPAPPEPFSIECKRMFLDGPTDNMFLVGGEERDEAARSLAFVKYPAGAAFAQQFCYRRKTETMTMPSEGRKKMVIHPAPPPASAVKPAEAATVPAPGGMLASGDTFISWTGPLYRELRSLPVPKGRDVKKQILSLNKDVVIEQPESKLVMYGETIRLHIDVVTNQLEYLFARDNVDIYMDDLQARGDVVMIDMAYDENGAETKKIITILGNKKRGLKADVFQGDGNAVRSDKFIIDDLTKSFDSFGGTVAVVRTPPDDPAKLPADPAKPGDPAKPAVAAKPGDSKKPVESPAPDAAQGAAGLVTNIKFDMDGDTKIQCRGLFRQDMQTNVVTAEDHVIIVKPDLTALADRIRITLDDTPPDPNAPKTPGDPKSPAGSPGAAKTSPPAASAPKIAGPPAAPNAAGEQPAAASNGFFSGGLKTLECFGSVELVTEDKLIHCDTMKFDAKDEIAFFECDDVLDDVRIYTHGEDGTDKLLLSQKNLRLDQKTGTFVPGGQLLIIPYKLLKPAPRGRTNSPSFVLRKKENRK